MANGYFWGLWFHEIHLEVDAHFKKIAGACKIYGSERHLTHWWPGIFTLFIYRKDIPLLDNYMHLQMFYFRFNHYTFLHGRSIQRKDRQKYMDLYSWSSVNCLGTTMTPKNVAHHRCVNSSPHGISSLWAMIESVRGKESYIFNVKGAESMRILPYSVP